MYQKDDLWKRQFIELLKELYNVYERFIMNGNIEDYDKAYMIHEKLNEAYGMSLDLYDYIELSGARFYKNLLPNKDQLYEYN